MLSNAILLGFACLACIAQPVPVRESQPAAPASCEGDRPLRGPPNGLRPPKGWLISDDSVAALYSFPRLVFSHPRLSGPYPRSVVMVLFQPSATQEERMAAIELVQGRLIGGMGNDYVLVIDDDGTANPLWAAVDKLCTLPQVFAANADILSFGLATPEE